MAYQPFDLAGKVLLVTGGNGGIGLGMADAAAQAGADVCIWGTNADKNSAASESLKAHGGKVDALICDVSDEAAVDAAFAKTLDSMGRVDMCVANAGVTGRSKSFLDISSDEWKRVLGVNLDGVFYTLKAAAAHMTVL